MPPNLAYRSVSFISLKTGFIFTLPLERTLLNLSARLLTLLFKTGIWLALTGVSSDPPSGYVLSVRSFALDCGRTKLRPGPIGSISRKETALCMLSRNPAWTKRICPSLSFTTEYSHSDSADSHYTTAAGAQLEVDRSHMCGVYCTTLGNSFQFPIRFLHSWRWGQLIWFWK